MKTPLLILVLLLAGFNLQARMVTLTITGNYGTASATNELTLGSNESIEAVGWYSNPTVQVVKDGLTFTWQASDKLDPTIPARHVIAGPALVRVISSSANYIQ